jgi:hypothetical protein
MRCLGFAMGVQSFGLVAQRGWGRNLVSSSRESQSEPGTFLERRAWFLTDDHFRQVSEDRICGSLRLDSGSGASGSVSQTKVRPSGSESGSDPSGAQRPA